MFFNEYICVVTKLVTISIVDLVHDRTTDFVARSTSTFPTVMCFVILFKTI